ILANIGTERDTRISTLRPSLRRESITYEQNTARTVEDGVECSSALIGHTRLQRSGRQLMPWEEPLYEPSEPCQLLRLPSCLRRRTIIKQKVPADSQAP